jgi:hypothetical protein
MVRRRMERRARRGGVLREGVEKGIGFGTVCCGYCRYSVGGEYCDRSCQEEVTDVSSQSFMLKHPLTCQ